MAQLLSTTTQWLRVAKAVYGSSTNSVIEIRTSDRATGTLLSIGDSYKFKTYEGTDITGSGEYSSLIDPDNIPVYYFFDPAATTLDLTNLYAGSTIQKSWGSTTASYKINPSTSLLTSLSIGDSTGRFAAHALTTTSKNAITGSTNNFCPSEGDVFFVTSCHASWTGNDFFNFAIIVRNGTGGTGFSIYSDNDQYNRSSTSVLTPSYKTTSFIKLH